MGWSNSVEGNGFFIYRCKAVRGKTDFDNNMQFTRKLSVPLPSALNILVLKLSLHCE